MRQDTLEMRGVAADLNFADRFRVAGPQAGIATHAAAFTRG